MSYEKFVIEIDAKQQNGYGVEGAEAARLCSRVESTLATLSGATQLAKAIAPRPHILKGAWTTWALIVAQALAEMEGLEEAIDAAETPAQNSVEPDLTEAGA